MAQDTKFIKTSTNNLFIKISYAKKRKIPPLEYLFIDKLKLRFSSTTE